MDLNTVAPMLARIDAALMRAMDHMGRNVMVSTADLEALRKLTTWRASSPYSGGEASHALSLGVPVYSVDFGAEGCGLYVRLTDFNRVTPKAISFTPPEGYVMVPVEPTDAQLDRATWEEVGGHCSSCTAWAASHGDARRVWAAMIAARPESP